MKDRGSTLFTTLEGRVTETLFEERLEGQFLYMEKLKKLGKMALRDHHDQKFHGTIWWQIMPKAVPNWWIIRRCFYKFCLENYHYPEDSEPYRKFKELAVGKLKERWGGHRVLPLEEKTLLEAKAAGQFSWEEVEKMTMNEVDRYLVALGLWADVSQKRRRQMLFEFFNMEFDDIETRKVRKYSNGRLNNKYFLRDLILDHPTMTYEEFKVRYGKDMPTTSYHSFGQQRYYLRKAGYDIPRLKPGMKRKPPNDKSN